MTLGLNSSKKNLSGITHRFSKINNERYNPKNIPSVSSPGVIGEVLGQKIGERVVCRRIGTNKVQCI